MFVGVVSRLDSVVSGVIVLARTSKAAARLSEQFRTGQVAKRYWAIVEGTVEPEQATLVDCLAKDDAARRVRVVRRGGQRGELHYRVLGGFEGQSLVEVDLVTGRKHQIRAQLASRGWPIEGDRKYGAHARRDPGIALHAVSLRFSHPTQNSPMRFDCRPPGSWRLNRFRVEFVGPEAGGD